MSWGDDPGTLHALTLAGAYGVTMVATGFVRALAPRFDFVSRPKGERWSQRPVALGGGIGIFVGLAPGLSLLSWDLFLGALIVFLLGLVDDRRPLSAVVKLVVQFLAAGLVIAAPLSGAGLGPLLIPGPWWLAAPLTAIWYVGMSNSVNLLDNMDGSAAGVAAVAAFFVFLLASGGSHPHPQLAAAAMAVCGASLGFLFHNFPPARIFMGDAGSLLLGFSLAALTVHLPVVAGQTEIPFWRTLAVPVFVLGAPLFDTLLVWFTRRAAKRPFLQGGRDHTTHRLMRLGLSPRRTLVVIYGVAAALGGVGLAVARADLGTAVTTLVPGGIVMVLLGLFLGEVHVYPGESPAATRTRPPLSLYVVEVGLDIAALGLAWIAAYAIRFPSEETLTFYLEASALPAMPFVIGAKVGALLWFGLYRGIWRTIRFEDTVAAAKAISLGSLLVVVAATIFVRFEDYSRGVFAIDWALSLVAVIGSRSALRVLRESVQTLAGTERRAVLLGPAELEPLVAQAVAADRHLTLVGRLDPPAADPEGELDEDAVGKLLTKLIALSAEVVVVGGELPQEDALLRRLAEDGRQVRRLRLLIE